MFEADICARQVGEVVLGSSGGTMHTIGNPITFGGWWSLLDTVVDKVSARVSNIVVENGIATHPLTAGMFLSRFLLSRVFRSTKE